jgi:hypothetical protein
VLSMVPVEGRAVGVNVAGRWRSTRRCHWGGAAEQCVGSPWASDGGGDAALVAGCIGKRREKGRGEAAMGKIVFLPSI